jgi:cyclopropane-fatty-acyl-phospholipid synthase
MRGLICRGVLTIIEADGTVGVYGAEPGGRVAIRLTDPHFGRKLVRDPNLAFGEGYMNGTVIVEEGDLYGLLALLMDNVMLKPRPFWRRPLNELRRYLQQVNPPLRPPQRRAPL